MLASVGLYAREHPWVTIAVIAGGVAVGGPHRRCALVGNSAACVCGIRLARTAQGPALATAEVTAHVMD